MFGCFPDKKIKDIQIKNGQNLFITMKVEKTTHHTESKIAFKFISKYLYIAFLIHFNSLIRVDINRI
jgi:hypothetical protein